MGEVTIKKLNGESVCFSAFFGFFGTTINAEALTEALRKNDISEKEIYSLTIKSDDIEISWGKQFVDYDNLIEIILIAKGTIRINCYNFVDSNVRRVSLQADELWFNDGAFCDSNQLESIICSGKILEGQNSNGLAEMLFMNCPQLKVIRGYYKGNSLMPYVFRNCTSLEDPLDIYVRNLGFHSFENCYNLKHIHLHNGLVDMGHSAFKNCFSLEDIYIPDTVTFLGNETFFGCKNLRKVHIPKGINGIPEMTFSDCTVLEKVFLPDGITSIGTMAFKGCMMLQRPWFPNGLKTIKKEAFRGCVSLGEVFLPESVEEIGDNAFTDCGDLVIHGKANSLAEKYAKTNDIVFVED